MFWGTGRTLLLAGSRSLAGDKSGRVLPFQKVGADFTQSLILFSHPGTQDTELLKVGVLT